MRDEWFKEISNYNKKDKARLAKDILLTEDCYVGMRSGEEIDECMKQGLFDLIIWVDAGDRLAFRESKSSFGIDRSYADIIIENNGTPDDLLNKLTRLAKLL